MRRGRVSPVPYINWGQLISVTAENVLGTGDVMLTFLGRKSTNMKSHKVSQKERRTRSEIASPPRFLRTGTNQRLPVPTPNPSRDVLNINISVDKCVFRPAPNALTAVTTCFHSEPVEATLNHRLKWKFAWNFLQTTDMNGIRRKTKLAALLSSAWT